MYLQVGIPSPMLLCRAVYELFLEDTWNCPIMWRGPHSQSPTSPAAPLGPVRQSTTSTELHFCFSTTSISDGNQLRPAQSNLSRVPTAAMASLIAQRAFATSARRLASSETALKQESKRNPELMVRRLPSGGRDGSAAVLRASSAPSPPFVQAADREADEMRSRPRSSA